MKCWCTELLITGGKVKFSEQKREMVRLWIIGSCSISGKGFADDQNTCLVQDMFVCKPVPLDRQTGFI